jgi:hypothetical protein
MVHCITTINNKVHVKIMYSRNKFIMFVTLCKKLCPPSDVLKGGNSSSNTCEHHEVGKVCPVSGKRKWRPNTRLGWRGGGRCQKACITSVCRKRTSKYPAVRSDFCDDCWELKFLSVPAKEARSIKRFTQTLGCPGQPPLFTVSGIVLGKEIDLAT